MYKQTGEQVPSFLTVTVSFFLITSQKNLMYNLILNTVSYKLQKNFFLNPLNAELNPICHLLALLGGATIVVVSRLRVNRLSPLLKILEALE
jgi:hypothetical protein